MTRFLIKDGTDYVRKDNGKMGYPIIWSETRFDSAVAVLCQTNINGVSTINCFIEDTETGTTYSRNEAKEIYKRMVDD